MRSNNKVIIFTAMVVARSISHAILLALIQIIIINVVASEYSTQNNNARGHIPPSRSGRSKRSLFDEMPKIIRVQARFSTGQIVNLRWRKYEQYLANQHLPVVMSSGYLDQEIMDNVGEFVVYHDLVTRSSVVYFKNLDAFFGFIGMGYFITYLPYKYDVFTGCYPDIVESPFLVELNDISFHIFPSLSEVDFGKNVDESSSDDSHRGIKRLLDSDEGPSDKHQRFDREVQWENDAEKMNDNISEIVNVRTRRSAAIPRKYYLEILVFVTRDIAEIFKRFPDGGAYIEWVVRYCIIYFNAIDMSFQSMRDGIPKLRINIAKIVIEDDETPFEFMSNGEFQYPESAAILRNNIKSHKDIYTPDSFDHIFVRTSLPITEDGRRLRAISESGTDLYTARKQNQYYSAVPLSILSYETDYAVAVHEIARTLSIGIDTTGHNGVGCSLQCSGFMRTGGSQCDICLKWSRESEDQFLSFTRNNRRRCFLINAPRSLRSPGPSAYLSPHKQCSCFGFDSYLSLARRTQRNYVKTTECGVPLKCQNYDENLSDEVALLPLDGTVCGNRNKVCWNGQCVLYRKDSDWLYK